MTRLLHRRHRRSGVIGEQWGTWCSRCGRVWRSLLVDEGKI